MAMEIKLHQKEDGPRVLKVLEALKQASHELQTHPSTDSPESNSVSASSSSTSETHSDLLTQLTSPDSDAQLKALRFTLLRSMADESQKWVLMVTTQTPTNIAVIKYWGKRDEKLILPVNDSINVTLDPAHLCTTTIVSVSPTFDQDRMWLNGEEISISGGIFQSCLKEIRRPLHRHHRCLTDRWQVHA
ncbi:hypothetical protein C1H46_037422 [Malus baccata]|uniref:Diphosphomevalonate decarboxylase-like N-terminal domain-containing protein n=1 Tax=Malus baccata TaxID=106549 RepID=A0A540KS44_MALBA|nr:hypothetical protein C1H46_037422 [Malus baccata]